MSYNDFLADQLSDARNNFLACKEGRDEFNRLYFVYKDLTLNMSKRHFSHDQDFSSPLELTYYSILEELVPELSPRNLQEIRNLDSELNSYINEWIDFDGVIAKLKYQTKPPNLHLIDSAA